MALGSLHRLPAVANDHLPRHPGAVIDRHTVQMMRRQGAPSRTSPLRFPQAARVAFGHGNGWEELLIQFANPPGSVGEDHGRSNCGLERYERDHHLHVDAISLTGGLRWTRHSPDRPPV